jgi:23S rRNA (pseudouridine1915-N3)-methyltransferase
VKVVICHIAPERSRAKAPGVDQLAGEYLDRASRYVRCEAIRFSQQRGLLDWVKKQGGRTAAWLVLLDRRGRELSSEELAAQLGRWRDGGAQTVIYAIGPADGWTAEARARADVVVSFGPITLPHELARVVLAEQVYRALTILAGHPYHAGH